MKKNIGPLDRLARLLLGNLFIFLALFGIIPNEGYYYVAGAAFMLTSFFSFCPLYVLLGISSLKTVKDR
jgi:hypothetical protein